jgi:hypothetical protein
VTATTRNKNDFVIPAPSRFLISRFPYMPLLLAHRTPSAFQYTTSLPSFRHPNLGALWKRHDGWMGSMTMSPGCPFGGKSHARMARSLARPHTAVAQQVRITREPGSSAHRSCRADWSVLRCLKGACLQRCVYLRSVRLDAAILHEFDVRFCAKRFVRRSSGISGCLLKSADRGL